MQHSTNTFLNNNVLVNLMTRPKRFRLKPKGLPKRAYYDSDQRMWVMNNGKKSKNKRVDLT